MRRYWGEKNMIENHIDGFNEGEKNDTKKASKRKKKGISQIFNLRI